MTLSTEQPLQPNTVANYPRPAFFVGITGSMAMPADSIPIIRGRVKQIIHWLQDGSCPHPGLGAPLNLSATPIVILSALAPGADQIVANVARDAGLQVRSPMPFPLEEYRQCSTFIQNKDLKEDEARLADFDKIVERVGEQNLFHVLLKEDLQLTENGDLKATLQADRSIRSRRNLRYRASGEFISAYCDLLIGITDQEEESAPLKYDADLPEKSQSGAQHVIRSHLTGLEPEILPIESALTWADNGPVIRIFCRHVDKKPADYTLRDGAIDIWCPVDAHPPDESPEETRAREVERIRSLARQLERLNASLAAIKEPPGVEDQVQKHFPAKPPIAYCPTIALLEMWRWLKAKARRGPVVRMKEAKPMPSSLANLPDIHRLAVLRRMVADQNYAFDGQVKTLMLSLVALTFAVAVLLQIYENWVVGHQQPAPGHIEWIRVGMFGTALALFGGGWIAHFRKKQSQVFDRQNDYRALAEGLRVQLYWTAAGTGRSVASNYLQRARGEMSWLRAAISAVSFPYEPARKRFQGCSDRQKHDILKRVHYGWIEEQLSFFTRRVHEFSQRKHTLHFIANALLIAGFVLLCTQFSAHTLEMEGGLVRMALSVGSYPLKIWIGGAVVLWLANQWIMYQTYQAVYCAGDHASRWIVRRHVSHHIFDSTQFLWLAGVSLGLSMACAAFTASATPASFPPPIKLIAVLKNLVFACGGLIHTWAVFKFLPENIRRYSAMRDLFRGASTRMKTLLDRFESPPAGSSTSQEKAQIIVAIHNLLGDLGREALHENADWIHMHRSKPVEPLLPAG